MNRISDPLRRFIVKYGNVETYDPEVVRAVVRPGGEFNLELLRMREQLLLAITDDLLGVVEMEYLTHNSFDSREEVIDWLNELLAEFESSR
jgi:hypothetical protein